MARYGGRLGSSMYPFLRCDRRLLMFAQRALDISRKLPFVLAGRALYCWGRLPCCSWPAKIRRHKLVGISASILWASPWARAQSGGGTLRKANTVAIISRRVGTGPARELADFGSESVGSLKSLPIRDDSDGGILYGPGRDRTLLHSLLDVVRHEAQFIQRTLPKLRLCYQSLDFGRWSQEWSSSCHMSCELVELEVRPGRSFRAQLRICGAVYDSQWEGTWCYSVTCATQWALSIVESQWSTRRPSLPWCTWWYSR